MYYISNNFWQPNDEQHGWNLNKIRSYLNKHENKCSQRENTECYMCQFCKACVRVCVFVRETDGERERK